MVAKRRPVGTTLEDYESSATIRDLGGLDDGLEYIKAHSGGERMEQLLDVGCGLGGLTTYVGHALGMEGLSGVDKDESRLEVAAGRGIRVTPLNVERDAFPCEDQSQDLVCSFGMFEHIVYYDRPLQEAARVLRPGGWLLIAMPNLGSYLNRISLLIGKQPRNVEVSTEIPAGILPWYRGRTREGKPLGHVHSATLGTMKELIAHHGFTVRTVRSSSPDFDSKMVDAADYVFGRFPSLARRFIIVAQRD